jgi:diguanylate cyclase (GGDEF)-like protein/PAS domain S-box-containing protein
MNNNLNAIKARILVVEDETIVALDIKQRLVNMEYQVVGSATSGEQAIQKAENLKPDLVLMDIKLKGKMDGIEAAEIIRKNYKLPVIFLTAFADAPTLQRAKITEAFGYILKPFEERELNINIEMALYKHQMEIKLRQSEERYSLAIQGANDGLWDWNLKTGEIFYSPRWKEILGYDEDEIGSDADDWMKRIHEDDIERFKLDLSNHLAGLTSHFNIEYRLFTKKDGYRWVLTRGLAVHDEDSIPYRMAGSLTDVTERKHAEQQLLHDAFHDTLTGLPNRALFLDRLSRSIERAKRSNQADFAVLFFDLDRFKVVNDSLGHQIGDQLLIIISERIKSLLRSGDTLARLGGDEFAILLEWLDDPIDGKQVSERILDDLKEPVQLAGQIVYISASIGIVAGSTEYKRPEDILRDADIAMYRAKSAGKASFAVFDTDLREYAITRLELEGDLRVALARNELQVFYQPIISLASGSITGFEALLRWFHPVRGLISPENFIPLAEETGLIVPIGRWVLKEACQQLQSWQVRFPSEPPLTMSVNFSGRQFVQSGCVQQIQQILKETRVSPSTLKLEITESLLMENSKTSIATLNSVRDMGIQLLIDDFGTGYSSLGYVQHFPIDTIKIDRIFVSQMGTNNQRSEIARTIIQLACELGLDTIAEGIETQEQLGLLKDLACGYGQGWLFSKAITRDEIEILLEKGFSLDVIEGNSLQPFLDVQSSSLSSIRDNGE